MTSLRIIDEKSQQVDTADLTDTGRQQIRYEAQRLIEELEELDSAEVA